MLANTYINPIRYYFTAAAKRSITIRPATDRAVRDKLHRQYDQSMVTSGLSKTVGFPRDGHRSRICILVFIKVSVRGKVCVRVFIEVGVRTCVSVCVILCTSKTLETSQERKKQ
jgi:hypothetical protein